MPEIAYVLCNLQFVMSKQEFKNLCQICHTSTFFKHKSVFLHNTYSQSSDMHFRKQNLNMLENLAAALYYQEMSAVNIIHSSIHSFA